MTKWYMVVCQTLGRVVQFPAQACVIILFSWARHFSFTGPLYFQVYEWIPVGKYNAAGNCAMDYYPIQREVEIFLLRSNPLN